MHTPPWHTPALPSNLRTDISPKAAERIGSFMDMAMELYNKIIYTR